MNVKVDTSISEELDKKIRELAKKEERSFCAMLRILVKIGYDDRTSEPGINERHAQ